MLVQESRIAGANRAAVQAAFDAAARQDCLEKLRLGESPHAAKGANAPIRLHAGEQKSD